MRNFRFVDDWFERKIYNITLLLIEFIRNLILTSAQYFIKKKLTNKIIYTILLQRDKIKFKKSTGPYKMHEICAFTTCKPLNISDM